MQTILLSEDMLPALACMLAEQLTGFTSGRRLRTVYPQRTGSTTHDYRRHAELQRTLRSLSPDWRFQVILFMRRHIRDERLKRGTLADFKTWLARVRDCDHANGHATTYTPHRPGLFLKPL